MLLVYKFEDYLLPMKIQGVCDLIRSPLADFHHVSMEQLLFELALFWLYFDVLVMIPSATGMRTASDALKPLVAVIVFARFLHLPLNGWGIKFSTTIIRSALAVKPIFALTAKQL